MALASNIFFGHGWNKLVNLDQAINEFPSILFIPADVGIALVICLELGCSLLIALGLATRIATASMVATMLAALGFVHIDAPFLAMELPLLYLFTFCALMFIGPGKLSMDAILAHQHKQKQPLISETPDPW